MTIPMMRQIIHKFKCRLAFIVLVGAVVGLTACGIKPGQLSPPGGKSAPTFPGTYPQD